MIPIIFFVTIYHLSLQECPEEISHKGISVRWHQSAKANNVPSDPKCYQNDSLVTRNCIDSQWMPPLENVNPCFKVVNNLDLSSCPPGYHNVLDNSNYYCYKIDAPSSWNFPCFFNGGASVITELSTAEINSVLESLIALNTSRYYWLPAQRQKRYNPVVWYVPGPHWGKLVNPKSLNINAVILKNCLLLDIKQRSVITESCSNVYPSLCFYRNDFIYPAKCPNQYLAFHFRSDYGTCFGIEHSDSIEGSTFDHFLKTKCKKPMSDHLYIPLTTFIFKKIATYYTLSDDMWCWFKVSLDQYSNSDNSSNCPNDNDGLITKPKLGYLEGAINTIGTLGLLNKSRKLPCMACEAEIIYIETEFMFEYNNIDNKIYLTIYYPSGLWKYNLNDKGFQCFSDAKGFVKVISVNSVTLNNTRSSKSNYTIDKNVEKIVYAIDLITDRPAQYWCEGHTKNFSLITTDKIIANPNGNEVHVFSLVTKYHHYQEIKEPSNIMRLLPYLTNLFNAKSVLLMDILELSVQDILIVVHLHIGVNEIYDDQALNLLEIYRKLKQTAELELPRYNCSFVNISSSLCCLPTTSEDFNITLEWEKTPIGHIAAPNQFCLQSNGLPVKRRCEGSYLMGSRWSDVEGYCDTTYTPSIKTKFLYQFVKGQVPSYNKSSFLTDGLDFVLNDVDKLIPADIYYLSMSLQQVTQIIKENETSVDLGNIENIAWAMDRVMILDCEYLRLAQTLNSTNVILNSVHDIIEIITQMSANDSDTMKTENTYQIAVQPKYVVQVSFPYFNNITGIAISRKQLDNLFTDMIIKPLYKNTSVEEILAIENLEVATWVPAEILNTLKINNNSSDIINKEKIHVILSIFYNDAVFQELKTQKHVINSRIINLSIPGYVTNFEYAIPLIFRQLNHSEFEKSCVYWDFNPQNINRVPGFWKKQGCYLVKNINDIAICECYHLTHFGQLLLIKGRTNPEEYSRNKNHTKALNIITLIGCFLSLIGIIGIWITALVFSNWRKKASTKVLLQLSTAIALPLLFIVIFNLDLTIIVLQDDGMYVISPNMRVVCIILGSLLHYSILASFMWMLITAVLQFVRYVRVLGVKRPSRFMFKFNLIGWGIPTIPVIIIVSLDTGNYIPEPSFTRKICYPNGIYLILGVLVPIILILVVNIVLFILVLHAISCRSEDKGKATDMDLVKTQIRLSIFLFFLLGLTWVFGILSFPNNLLFSYLFCLTSTLQGFILFVYFIICDPSTRNLWVTLMKPPVHQGTTRNSISSISTT